MPPFTRAARSLNFVRLWFPSFWEFKKLHKKIQGSNLLPSPFALCLQVLCECAAFFGQTTSRCRKGDCKEANRQWTVLNTLRHGVDVLELIHRQTAAQVTKPPKGAKRLEVQVILCQWLYDTAGDHMQVTLCWWSRDSELCRASGGLWKPESCRICCVFSLSPRFIWPTVSF